MIADITIPPEAVEAAARAMCKRAYEHLPEMREQDTFTPDADYWMGQATAALRAGIAAWSGMAVNDGCPVWHAYPHIILPLPQEVSDE